jgi:ABC-type nitrate/sulfonate/bicarbonate transport system substrate-binding protein
VVSNGVASTGKDKADFGGVVTREASIKTAGDLAGKRVAVNTLKNIGDTTIRASVRKAGGDPSSIKFVELAFPDMPAALQAGRVDAIWVVEPFLSTSLAQGGRLVASNYVDTAPDLTVAVYFTSEQLIKNDPDLVKRFTDAMAESLAYADAHPDEARQVLTSYTKIDQAVIKELTLPKWPAAGSGGGWAWPDWAASWCWWRWRRGPAWSPSGTCPRPAGSPLPWPTSSGSRRSGRPWVTPWRAGPSGWPWPWPPGSGWAC